MQRAPGVVALVAIQLCRSGIATQAGLGRVFSVTSALLQLSGFLSVPTPADFYTSSVAAFHTMQVLEGLVEPEYVHWLFAPFTDFPVGESGFTEAAVPS